MRDRQPENNRGKIRMTTLAQVSFITFDRNTSGTSYLSEPENTSPITDEPTSREPSCFRLQLLGPECTDWLHKEK